ncbi:MAG: putative hydroxymethylpyrimidine transporter CytX [Oscillospiraceae bacterium]
MQETKTSVFSNGLIWFGAAVSIAEILTGTLLAPLGFAKGLAAILLGHLFGCLLLYAAGLIGAKTEKSAMETVKLSFGEKGSLLFSSLNVLQLVGWTAVMIVSGGAAASSVIALGGTWVWSLIIGGLILVWILVGLKNLGKLNLVAMGGLLLLTIVMSAVVFRGDLTAAATGDMRFGAAVELSVAMPLSWLPLISDYTRVARKKQAATFVSAAVYFAGSSWMYVIGMGAALFTGESDIAKIMVSAGLGLAGLLIIIFSTVTTTFLDVYSAGVSCVSLSGKINEKWAAIVVCVVGTALAIFAPTSQFEGFLYLIGSVFAPMIAILITDFFVLKKDSSALRFDRTNLLLWAVGFAAYRVMMRIDTPIGNTMPVMVIVSVLCIALHAITVKNKGKKQEEPLC